MVIPRSYFVTSGKAVSGISKLSAFDLALNEAGISQCNLVKVSSIIPPNCVEKEPMEIIPGTITYTVLSKAEGSGERISAGLTWGISKFEEYGIVAEINGFYDQAITKKRLKDEIRCMARVRRITLTNIKYRIETLVVPKEAYGCVIVALIYLF